MTPPASGDLYQLRPHLLGAAVDGRSVSLAPMTAEAAAQLGPQFATFGPWQHYGIAGDQMTSAFRDATGGNRPFAILAGDDLAGAAIVRDPWLMGPYLVFLGVLPEYQSQKIGDAVLGWFESEARRGNKRNIWLCVTGMNTGAQRFYRAHGFDVAATLPDLVRDGDDEIMMRKRLT